MIIIGYQGIGKSTLAGYDKFIDLESGNMFVDGKRADDWYIPYCQMAMNLSDQDFDVFVSSHKVVRDYLSRQCTQHVVQIFPSLDLKEFWIYKLKNRWTSSGLDKDYRAYINAQQCFDDNIKDLLSERFDNLQIVKEDYQLLPMIISYKISEGLIGR